MHCVGAAGTSPHIIILVLPNRIVITNQCFDKKYSINSRSHELSEVQVDLFKECEKVQFVVYSKLKSCTELT
jgi:hypothetical protein